MSDNESELDEHEIEVVHCISEILEIMPKSLSARDMSTIIINMVEHYEMNALWAAIALDATFTLHAIEDHRRKNRTLN